MRLRRRLLLFALVMVVLFLAAFSMFVILVSMRPLDPESLRAPMIGSSSAVGESAV